MQKFALGLTAVLVAGLSFADMTPVTQEDPAVTFAGNVTVTSNLTATAGLTLTGTSLTGLNGITATGAVTIAEGALANDTVVEADLKAVDTASDEDFFTYESTTGDFEWHSAADKAGTIAAAITEGQLADSVVVSADIKNGEISDADIADGISLTALNGITATGAVTIGEGKLANDTIVEADLKAVDSANDEDFLSYESTTGDFEWHSASEIAGKLSSLNATNTIISGDNKTNVITVINGVITAWTVAP